MISGYVPAIRFRPDADAIFRKDYLTPRVERFFSIRKITNVVEIAADLSISDADFKQVCMSYFYETMFGDLAHARDVRNFAAYTITYDKALASDFCAESGMSYSRVLLGGAPLFYFLFLDIEDILSFLKTNSLPIG